MAGIQCYNTFDSIFETMIGTAPLNNGKHFNWNVIETYDAYEIQAELPGINPENIDIDITNNTITITAQKEKVVEDNIDVYYHKERIFGTFQRSVKLPKNIDVDKVHAFYRDGVLHVNIKKTSKPIRKYKVEY